MFIKLSCFPRFVVTFLIVLAACVSSHGIWPNLAQAKSIPAGTPQVVGQQETHQFQWRGYCVKLSNGEKSWVEEIIFTTGKDALAAAQESCEAGKIPVGVRGLFLLSGKKPFSGFEFYFPDGLSEQEIKKIENLFKNK